MTALARNRRLEDITGLVPLAEVTRNPDPKAAYARLREQWGEVAPVELEPGVPAWLVLGYHEVVQVSRNDRLFSRHPKNWRYFETLLNPETTLTTMIPQEHAYFADGDEHRRLRAPIDDGLAELDPHRMSRSMQEICRDLIANFADRGEADLVAEYAVHVPMLAVANWFGMDAEQGRQVAQAMIQLLNPSKESQQAHAILGKLLTEHLAARRESPAKDVATVFLRHPNLHNDVEIMFTMMLTMGAGCQGTGSWIAETLRVLLTDSRFRGRFRGGRLDLDDALDEVLWRNPPWTNMQGGYALADTEIGGQRIHKGDAVILSLIAANLDPRVHTDDPWLEIGNRAHISYGIGPHVCPAHQPSRIVARIAVETAMTRLHDLKLTIPAEEIVTIPSLWTTCPASLPVRFSGTA